MDRVRIDKRPSGERDLVTLEESGESRSLAVEAAREISRRAGLRRMRRTEKRLKALESTIGEFQRMRRDLAVAVLVLLVALALQSPQIWGVVAAWTAAKGASLRADIVP